MISQEIGKIGFGQSAESPLVVEIQIESYLRGKKHTRKNNSRDQQMISHINYELVCEQRFVTIMRKHRI